MNKNDNGKDLYRTLGSIDIVAAARSILMVRKADEEKQELRKIIHVKSNLAPKGKSISFALENDTLTKWKYVDGDDNVEMTMEQLAEQELKKIVGINGISSRDGYDYMEEKGFSRRTVERAKCNLAIKSKKQGQHWMWILE